MPKTPVPKNIKKEPIVCPILPYPNAPAPYMNLVLVLATTMFNLIL
jgi:hypothetical protein